MKLRITLTTLLLVVLSILVVASAQAASLCPGPQRCPSGDVRWFVYGGGRYVYTDGSALVWGNRDRVYWSHAEGYSISYLCVQTWRGLWVWDEMHTPPQHGWLDDAKGPICEVAIETVQ